MWIMLSDAFFSIVAKDCARDELMVRARRPGDIEKVFPEAKGRVVEFTASDYHYRCPIKRESICRALCGEVMRITYSNFKDSVADRRLHDAYLRVWTAMAALQPKAPYSGARRAYNPVIFDDDLGAMYRLSPEEDAHLFATGHMPDEEFEPAPQRKKRKAKRSMKRGR